MVQAILYEDAKTLATLFSKVAKNKPLKQDEVISAINLMLNDPAPSDEDIIKAMTVLVERLPAEQHFDVWSNVWDYRDAERPEGEISPVTEFIAERGLDSVEDLPRNKRSHAAFHYVWEDSGLPKGHPIQVRAIETVLKHISYYLLDYSVPIECIKYTDSLEIKKRLLNAAIPIIHRPSGSIETVFDVACELLGIAQDLEDRLAQKTCFELAATYLQKLPNEEQNDAKDKLLGMLEKGDPLLKVSDQVLEQARIEATPSPVSEFVQKVAGLDARPK